MNLKILKLLRLCHVLNKSTYKKLRAIEVVRHSSLFDKQWYLENYPDVKEAGQDPARHYCLFGWKEGRNPGPNFNSTRYLDQNPDIKQGNLNPLVHYEKFGKKEGRIPLQSEPKKEFVSAKKKERRDYFFSVIVASYNYQDYIQKTLDSLVAQTYKNFEVIVVDDGSTDESVKVIEKYVQKYPFIRLYQHENGINKGLPETVLLGVQKSKGEYVAFCEGDDYWAKNHLKELNKKINSENDVQIVVNDVQIFGDKKRCEMMGRIISDRKKTILKQCGLLSDDQFCVHNYIVSFSCCCVERMLLTTCDFVGVPNKVKLDWWLWRQICYQNRIYYINKKLTYWRLHLSDNVRNIEGEKCTEFVEKLNKIMDKRKYDSVYSNDQDISGIDKSQISECKTKKKTLIKRIKDGNWQGIKICYVSTTKQISCPIKDGSVRYRCYHPAEALSSKGAFVTVVSHSNFLKAPSYHYDIYIFHRPCKLEFDLIEGLKKLGKVVIADYDDLIFGNKEIALQSSIYKNLKITEAEIIAAFKRNKEALLQCDFISVSTEGLKQEVLRFHPNANVFVIHNFIPESILRLADKCHVREAQKDKDLLMYCTGTLSHNMDFAQIEKVLLSCLEKDNQLKLYIFGVLTAPEKFQKHGRVFFHNIVDYWDLFNAMSLAAFTIAPLEIPSRFNECKSNVKFLESSIAGATLFATPIGDMERVQKAGIKLCSTPDEWDSAILNRHQMDLQQNIKKNFDYVVRNCSNNNFIKEFTNIFNNMES